MRGVFFTAGAAGMYCGSCLHDNALARALRSAGVDCLLQPVYTPIRVDGASVAADQLFFGGIQIYLLQQLPWLSRVPSPLRRILDWPPLIQLATRRAASTDAAKLGALTVSMLQGVHGRQAKEVSRLVDWLVDEIHPDAVVLSNLLIGGALPEIRRRLPDARLIVILQGDDIFLDHLPEAYRRQCVDLCSRLIESVDTIVVNSRFYADKMGSLFSIAPDKIEIAPLSIDTAPFANLSVGSRHDQRFRIGYLARIAPEKGFHHIVDSFVQLADQDDHADVELHAAGWLGESNHDYLDSQREKIAAAGLSDRFVYHGSPDLEDKIRFLQSLDVLSVPTDYHEPKGLFVLEALAAGVPVIQPDHGAFGELIEATGGGLLVPPGDCDALTAAIVRLKADPQQRSQLAAVGRQRVISHHSVEAAAEHLRRLMFP